MTDRELLEKAAKAAGIDGDYTSEPFAGIVGREIGSTDFPWNPLRNDGQALRLAVKLRLTIVRTDCQCCVIVCGDIENHEIEERVRLHEVDDPEEKQQDEFSATRRAIVRAAAAIGETM